MNLRALLRRPRTWFIVVPVVIVVAALGGPVVYTQLFRDDPPPRLSFADVTTSTTIAVSGAAGRVEPATTVSGVTTTVAAAVATAPKAALATAGPVDGSWRVGAGSLSGYRIGEYLGLTRTEAVGRTDKVTGAMTIAGTTVTAGSWTVDMESVKSDDARRDQNYRNSMAVDQYPTSTFVLSGPLDFSAVPPDGTDIKVHILGSLTLRGVTNAVDFEVQARRKNNRIEVVGAIPVRFEDYKIPNPSNGYARTDEHGLVEFLLLFERG